MESQDRMHIHLSSLISGARIKNGFATLKEFFRVKEPQVDYQSWLHVESGRRIPSPKVLVLMGDLLDIPREELIIAYCRDKFADVTSHKVLNALQAKGFFDLAILMQAKDHDRSEDYVFTAEQVKAMQEDLRIRHFLIYTYADNLTTTTTRLAEFFGLEKIEVQKVVNKLVSLGLAESDGEFVRKTHFHTTIPLTADIADLRKRFLLSSLDISLTSESFISNYHITLSDKSYKKILAMFDLIEANLVNFEKDDLNDPKSVRYQITMAGTKMRGLSGDHAGTKSNSK